MANEVATTKQTDRARFSDLISRGSKLKLKGKEIEELRGLFAKDPALWRNVDMAWAAAVAVGVGESRSPAVQAVSEANYQGKERELTRPQDGPLERTLVKHVALCWLRLQCVEQRYSLTLGGSLGIPQADYWERRLSATQRRFLRAVETLARIRKMQLPAMQVNVATEGGQQVNIAN